MTNFSELTVDEQIASLQPVVQEAAKLFGIDLEAFESINHEFNSTFKLVDKSGERFALRVNINSDRTIENLLAEVNWVRTIESVKTPKPLSIAGQPEQDFVAQVWHEELGRPLHCVVYTWLEGEEPGDEPSLEQVGAIGAAMARLHMESRQTVLPSGCALPQLDHFLWHCAEQILSTNRSTSEVGRSNLERAYSRIQDLADSLFAKGQPQPIHADLHPWNVMWNQGELAVFDFDDSGFGFPIQDLATAIYYLDTPEQERALLDGYSSVAKLPSYTFEEMQTLLIQRRLVLANYLFETSNPEHLEMAPEYLEETERRIALWLEGKPWN